MSDSIHFEHSATKVEKYQTILPQIAALIADETDQIANMANISAVLKEVFSFWWVGFYIVKQDELVLGPFQGPLACTRIQKGKVYVERLGPASKVLLCLMWKILKVI